jgi:chromosome segregation ATPase
MHITEVEIWNYQSHGHTKVKLTTGINAFVGTSDSGKSAFLRATKWNLTNQPAGAEFITIGETEACVLTHWSDGHSVERKRNKTGSRNTYTLLKDGVIIEEFTGFGSRVPQAILDVTGINPEMAFNFANQLEAPFLLSDSPKVRAETVGNLEELGRIDSELTTINDDIRITQREHKARKAEVATLEKEKMELERVINKNTQHVETIRALKDAIVEKDNLYQSVLRSSSRVRSFEQDIELITSQVNRSSRVLDKWDDDLPNNVNVFTSLANFNTRLETIQRELTQITSMDTQSLERLIALTTFVSEFSNSHERILYLQERLLRVQTEQAKEQKSASSKAGTLDLRPLDLEVERYTTLFKQRHRLKEIEQLKVTTAMDAERITGEIERLLHEFVEALQTAEICPICTQSTTGVTEERIKQTI